MGARADDRVQCSAIDGTHNIPAPSADVCRTLASEYQFYKNNRSLPPHVLLDHCVSVLEEASPDLGYDKTVAACELIPWLFVNAPPK